ncbi:CCA tRNA nucleotidyltransferase [Cyanobacteria bacterium FACHB-471]|nr:CCA tRNA nucleotidyltransferase [Cyanobacteria bacterium FACHB-471]
MKDKRPSYFFAWIRLLNCTNLHLDCDPPQECPAAASVLFPQTWPFGREWLPRATYLVGGNVRDALLGRNAEYLDLDFVLPERAVETARAIANHYKAGFVLLDAERQIARVVFDMATVDFAQQVGHSLETDLQRRDFTVNAIAYHPHTEELLDPLQGYGDLQQRLIRMIAPENLKEDPLRLLRAYRQAAQLDFTLEPETQTTIQKLAGLLEEIAAERVQAELSYLLSTPKGTPFLKMAWQDGLLQYWLPHATVEGLTQIEKIDQAAIALSNACPPLGLELLGWVRDQQKFSGAGRSWLKVAKLTRLIGTLETAEPELWRLKYSRTEVQAVLMALKFLPQMPSLVLPTTSLREKYFFFQQVGAIFPALVVLAVAMDISIEAIAPLIERFLNLRDPVAHPTPLLTGRDLMSKLKLPPGPQIGQLLEALQIAQAEGKISTPEEALQFAQVLADATKLQP